MADIHKIKENPVFDPSKEYALTQGKSFHPFYTQGENIFDMHGRFMYSLSDELSPSQIANNNGYNVEILEIPIPYETIKNVLCPVCDYKSGTRWKVSLHCDAVHGKHLATIERELNIYLNKKNRR